MKRPELARVAESVDLTRPTMLTSDSSSDASSSSSSSESDDSAANSSCSCSSCQKAHQAKRSVLLVRWHWCVQIVSGLSLGTCMSNLKSIPLTILEILAFNTQKFSGLHDPGDAPFSKILRSHVQTVAGNMHVIFEVRSFNHFGAISI